MSDWTDPVLITAITTAITAIIGAIGLVIRDWRKSKKVSWGAIKNIISQSTEEVENIKKIIEKKKDKKK